MPPQSAIAPPDGKRFVRNAVEFFTQAIAPDRNGGIATLPAVTVAPNVASAVAEFERHGHDALQSPAADCNRVETAYVEAIAAADNEASESVVDTAWWTALDGVADASTVQPGGTLDVRHLT